MFRRKASIDNLVQDKKNIKVSFKEGCDWLFGGRQALTRDLGEDNEFSLNKERRNVLFGQRPAKRQH